MQTVSESSPSGSPPALRKLRQFVVPTEGEHNTGLRFLSASDIGRITHEANRAYCLAFGDTSQPRWEDAPEWQRESAWLGVQSILSGETRQPSDSHRTWLAHKEANGWKYGPVKDPERKEHPCMVPYDELSDEQRVKDHLFFSIVTSLTEPVE